MLVFVYGTLKTDEPNYHWLTNQQNGKAKLVCTGKTLQMFPLVIASKYNIPFLCDKPGTGKNIEGEVYEIDEKMLANLDILEEYPKLYIRRFEKIVVNEPKADSSSLDDSSINTGNIIEAWIYLLKDFQPKMLELPNLECYSSSGPHNLPYSARYIEEEAKAALKVLFSG